MDELDPTRLPSIINTLSPNFEGLCNAIATKMAEKSGVVPTKEEVLGQATALLQCMLESIVTGGTLVVGTNGGDELKPMLTPDQTLFIGTALLGPFAPQIVVRPDPSAEPAAIQVVNPEELKGII